MARSFRGLTGVAAASLIALAASGVLAHADTLDLTIGGLLESTGPLSELGPTAEKAGNLAAAVATKAAKDAGFDAVVTFAGADSQGDPQAAQLAARTLVDKGAACLVGPATTPEAISVLNGVTMQRKMTMWPLASSTRLRTVKDDGTIYRTVSADSLQSKALIEAVSKHVGTGKTMAIVFRNEPYGDALSKSLIASWEALGGTISSVVAFDPQQAAFDSEATQVVEGGPDAIVVIDYPETYAKLGAALVRTGKFDPKTTFFADAMSFSNVPESIPAESINGSYVVSSGSPVGTASYALFDKLWAEFGGVENASYTANTFDSGILCFLAAVKAGSNEPGAIRDNVRLVTQAGAPQFTLETLSEAVKAAATGEPIDYVGVTGEFRFADNGDPTSGLYDLSQYLDGKQVRVEQISVK